MSNSLIKRLLIAFLFMSFHIGSIAQSSRKLIEYAAHIGYFNQLCPQEKVYLHLDNTAYFQGETIWYAANVVGQSKVLYVELLSPDGVVLKQQKLKVVDGRCHGSFPLIDSDVERAVNLRGAVPYPSGFYQIRAYTHAMLNFDETSVYCRTIPVYGSPEIEGNYDSPVLAHYSTMQNERPILKHNERLKELNISFFPEGGHLISTIPTRIAFKVTDKFGMGVNIDGMTIDNGDEIAISKCHKGMGYFIYMSEKGGDKVLVEYQGKKYSFNLPLAESIGCTLFIDNMDKDTLKVKVNEMGIIDRLAYTITSEGEVIAFDTVHFMNHVSLLHISKHSFPNRICQFTLYGSSGVVYAQRLFFVDNGCPTVPVTVTADKEAYRPFDEVKLHLQAATTDSATFSLAVRDAADYGTAYRDDIRTYMLLSSELKGLIEDPGWYFEPDVDNTLRSYALDLLMMVQGWTRYNWQLMAGKEPFKAKYYTESQMVIDGWAFSRILERPLKDVIIDVRLYSPDRKQKQEAVVTTDSLGYWSLGLEDFEGIWDLRLTMEQSSKMLNELGTRIRLGRSTSPLVRAFLPEEVFLPNYVGNDSDMIVWEDRDKTAAIALFPNLSEEIEGSYLLDEVEILGKRRYIDYNRFHAFNAQKDGEIQLDKGEYTTDVIGYLMEKGYSVQCEYSTEGDRLVNVLVDGHKTSWRTIGGKGYTSTHSSNSKRIWNYTLDELKSIIVYDYEPGHRYTEVEVVLPDINERKEVSGHERTTTFSGYSTPVEFYAPTYPNGPVQGDKDYRRTVYWNPEVTTDANGVADVSFYNNGYSRSLTVSAEGLTADGVPIIY